MNITVGRNSDMPARVRDLGRRGRAGRPGGGSAAGWTLRDTSDHAHFSISSDLADTGVLIVGNKQVSRGIQCEAFHGGELCRKRVIVVSGIVGISSCACVGADVGG